MEGGLCLAVRRTDDGTETDLGAGTDSPPGHVVAG